MDKTNFIYRFTLRYGVYIVCALMFTALYFCLDALRPTTMIHIRSSCITSNGYIIDTLDTDRLFIQRGTILSDASDRSHTLSVVSIEHLDKRHVVAVFAPSDTTIIHDDIINRPYTYDFSFWQLARNMK